MYFFVILLDYGLGTHFRDRIFFLDKSAKEIVIHRVVYSVAYEEKVLAVVLELKTAPPRSKE